MVRIYPVLGRAEDVSSGWKVEGLTWRGIYERNGCHDDRQQGPLPNLQKRFITLLYLEIICICPQGQLRRAMVHVGKGKSIEAIIECQIVPLTVMIYHVSVLMCNLWQ